VERTVNKLRTKYAVTVDGNDPFIAVICPGTGWVLACLKPRGQFVTHRSHQRGSFAYVRHRRPPEHLRICVDAVILNAESFWPNRPMSRPHDAFQRGQLSRQVSSIRLRIRARYIPPCGPHRTAPGVPDRTQLQGVTSAYEKQRNLTAARQLTKAWRENCNE
jgi:hypothetical protein